MALYTVTRRYYAFSDGKHYGPYEAGQSIDLDPAEAEWVNRDSPGCLTEVGTKPAKTKAKEPERQAAATPNRQHKGGRNRAGG